MKAAVLSIGAVLALAGCATTGNVMDRAPVASFVSSNSVSVTAECLTPIMLAQWPQTKVAPSGDGQMIIVSGSAWGNPVAIFTIEHAYDGSHVALRRGSVADQVLKSIETSARACI